MSKQYAFYFDSNACSGCKACEMACRDKHDLAEGIHWRRVYEIAGGQWEKKENALHQSLIAYNISMSCNHCEDAACVHACPTGAMQKRQDGIVFIDPDKCMGCKYCAWACPYDAPQFDKSSGLMTKCDFCMDYIEQDRTPSCVAACPMRVLEFGELQELQERYGEKHVFPLPDETLTRPAFVLQRHHAVKDDEYGHLSVINKEEIS